MSGSLQNKATESSAMFLVGLAVDDIILEEWPGGVADGDLGDYILVL